MKRNFFLLFLLFSTTANAADNQHYYDRFQQIADESRAQDQEEGLSYMIGGGVGFASSLALGITSQEVLPKIGYSLIQGLSGAAFYYGAVTYYNGDRLTTEANRLKTNELILRQNKRLSELEIKSILNQMTEKVIQQEQERQDRVRKIRGYVALSTAASSGLTMALSKSHGTASDISLGFILLISTVGATSDLFFPAKTTKLHDLFTLEPIIGPGYMQAGLSYHW